MTHDAEPSAEFARYARQMRYAPLGEEGQRRLAGRAGAGLRLRGAGFGDRQYAGPQRRWATCGWSTAIFWSSTTCSGRCSTTKPDVAAGLPKAIAAANKLRKINSQITIEPLVTDVDPTKHRWS